MFFYAQIVFYREPNEKFISTKYTVVWDTNFLELVKYFINQNFPQLLLSPLML